MKRIAIGLLLALIVSSTLVGVAAAQGWPPYYYAGWSDCYPPGCIPPYNYGMYGGYGAAYNHNTYNYEYNYNYTYNYNNYNYDYNNYNHYNYAYSYNPYSYYPGYGYYGYHW
jgi:hypothetical protein